MHAKSLIYSIAAFGKQLVKIMAEAGSSQNPTKRQGSSSAKVYFGETMCQAKYESGNKANESCTSKAYFKKGSRYLCGKHSPGNRTKLPKNPNAAKIREDKLSDHAKTVEAAKLKNQKAGVAGQVMCSKIGMRTKVEDCEGYLKIFPNFKHQGRKDGFGCSSLSPMSLGPVHHGQKGLPPCKLLENYHQFNKVYNVEAGKDGRPTKIFYSEQLKGYKTTKPMRRKYTSKSSIPGRTTQDKPRTLYSLHLDSEGKEKKYDYVKSRYFYCHFYEKLVKGNKDLDKLRAMLAEGTNLQIVGYDGFSVYKDLMYHYTDPSRPFGHELVVYTLLTVKDPKEYPWNKYYEMHSEYYPSKLKPGYLIENVECDNEGTSPSEETEDMETDEDISSDESCESD